MTNQLEFMIQNASQSKQDFINFLHEIEIAQAYQWVASWIEKFWTDTMSKVFFDKFWKGSLDYCILDDIERCMIALDPRPIAS